MLIWRADWHGLLDGPIYEPTERKEESKSVPAPENIVQPGACQGRQLQGWDGARARVCPAAVAAARLRSPPRRGLSSRHSPRASGPGRGGPTAREGPSVYPPGRERDQVRTRLFQNNVSVFVFLFRLRVC